MTEKKKLHQLTDEQRGRIPAHVAEWIQIGLSTEPADRSKAEEAIIACYKYAGLTPVSITWVDSPMAGALTTAFAASILRTDKSKGVKGSVRGAVSKAVAVAVLKAVRVAVSGAVRGAVEEAVSVAVSVAVSEAVRGAVEEAVSEAVRGAVEEDVEEAVSEAVRGAVEEDVEEAVSEAVRVAVRVAVSKAVEEAVSEAVRGAVEEDVSEAVSVAVEEAVSEAVRVAVSEAVSEAVRVAVRGRGHHRIKWHYWLGGAHWAAWPAYVAYFLDVCGVKLDPEIMARARTYEAIARSCGYWWPNRRFCIASDRPSSLSLDERGRLHAEGHMAIQYRDGWGLWMLHGVRVPRAWAELSVDQLDPIEILKEPNVEIRAAGLRRAGIGRLLDHAKILDGESEYVLYSLNLGEDLADCRYLRMLNPSTAEVHLEGVAPSCETVEQAINWRAGGRVWKPEVLT